LPVLTMSGLQGRFFAPLGVAFILSVFASLIVALTVTPALSFMLLSGSATHREPAWIRAMKGIHRDWCVFFAKRPRLTGLAALLLAAGSLLLAGNFKGELL